MNSVLTTPTTPRTIDARGARFSAAVTAFVLAVALLLSSPTLLVLQGAVFAVGVILGPQRTPYARFFKLAIAPRLRSVPVPEPVEPPRFAQAVGLLFALLGLAGALVAPTLFIIATAMAFGAAFLNAAFGFCLGCQMYLSLALLRDRLTPVR